MHYRPATSLSPDWLLLRALRRSQKWELMFEVLNKDTGFHQRSSCSPQAPAWAIAVLNAAASASALLPAMSWKVSVAGRHKPHSSVKQVRVCKAETAYGASELLSHLWVRAGEPEGGLQSREGSGCNEGGAKLSNTHRKQPWGTRCSKASHTNQPQKGLDLPERGNRFGWWLSRSWGVSVH